MSNKIGLIGLAVSFFAIGIMILCIDSHEQADAVNHRLAPFLAKLLNLMSVSSEIEPSFRAPSIFDITEEKAIYLIGGLSVLLGFVSVALGFKSIKFHERPSISFGSIFFGLAPIVLLSIGIALIVILLTGFTAVVYKKQLTSTSNSAA